MFEIKLRYFKSACLWVESLRWRKTVVGGGVKGDQFDCAGAEILKKRHLSVMGCDL